MGLRLQLRKAQAEAGDIILLYGDESEALTHPYLARAWALRGADLRVPAPGQAKKVAIIGSLDHVTRQLIVHTSQTKRSRDFIAHLEQLDHLFGPQPGRAIKPVVLVEDNGPIHVSKLTLKAIGSPTLPLPPPLVRPMFNSNSGIWSGASLTNPTKEFCAIQADWTVPGVFALPGAPGYSAAAEWIGLDNSGTDLYQSGTDSECLFALGFPFWTVTNYWMWIESLPFPPWAVPNFTVSPGDSISVDIFVADENGTTWYQNGTWGGLTPQDNSVWFMLYNNSRNLSYWGTLPTAAETGGGLSSTPFTGSSAEFILERPSIGSPGNYVAQPLAFFLFTAMQGCWYGDAQYGDQRFPLGADGSSPFDGNLSYLNMLNSATGDLLDFAISVPDPTSSEGSEILWFWTSYQ